MVGSVRGVLIFMSLALVGVGREDAILLRCCGVWLF